MENLTKVIETKKLKDLQGTVVKTKSNLIEPTEAEVRVLTPASAGTTAAGGTFELWYED
jgi:hypothetical protein